VVVRARAPADHAEHILPKADELFVTRTPERAEGLQIVDRFQEIRLALGVVADESDTLRGKLQILRTEVPEVA
jgi:hypothetical protein